MGPSMLLRARGLDSPFPCSSYGRPPVRFPSKVVTVVDVEHDDQEIIQRVAALDVGKAELVCCVRVPGPGRRRLQEVRTFSTMTRSLLMMSDWLAGLGVTRVVMEATSDYVRHEGA